MAEELKRIDKHYWLNKGYEMVNGGLERTLGHIEAISKYINGLLGVYVLATVIDSIYMEIDTIWKIAIVLAPVLIVKIAEFYSKILIIPEAKSFYPDSAESCEATYYQFLRDARKHLKKMKDFAAVATAVLLGVLVLVTKWTVDSKNEELKEQSELVKVKKELLATKSSLDSIKKLDVYYLNTKILKKEKKLLLESNLPKSKEIKLQLFSNNNVTLDFPKHLLIGSMGKFYCDYDISALSNKIDTIKIKLKYKLSKNEYREIQKTIALKN